jgi:nicotinamide mononucleotide transporter
VLQSGKAIKSIEIIAVISSLLYTWLYLHSNPVCWYFAFLGAFLFLLLCIKKNILAEAFLQFFYMVMAVYGFVNSNIVWQEHLWPLERHLLILLFSIIGVVISFFYLRSRTSSVLPLTDSFTTIFAISGTGLMVNMVHINWLYWIAVDAVSIYLYYNRGMKYAALLFVVYLAMALDGYFRLSIF